MKDLEIQSLVRKNIIELTPYSAARYEFSGKDAILLDANENPHRSEFNRYPDPWQMKLKEEISLIKGLGLENIFVGNGADEAIDLLIRAFCEPGIDNILVNDPTYSMYKVSAQINGTLTKHAKLNPDFSLNEANINEATDQNTKIIFLCSPVNPSGNLLDKATILRILESFQGLVVIDEAYIDFCEDPGFIPELHNHNNLVVVQTFSKAWALAGIRVGMAFGNAEIISILNKIKPPYNVSGPAQELAINALKDQGKFEQMVGNILEQRNILENFLEEYTICEKVYPSEANFILAKFRNSNALYEYLKHGSVIVRDRSFETNCDNCLRITIGTKDEVSELITLFRNYEEETAVY